MNRHIYKCAFSTNDKLQWICPICSKNFLQIKEGTFKTVETMESRRIHNSADWDPESIEYVYTCLLECTNSRCKEVVTSTGRGFVDFDYLFEDDESQSYQLINVYRPKYFYPNLNIFSYPTQTPKDVSRELNCSFELFFSNPPSAANHLRIAVENLLTYLGVKKYKLTSRRKRILINTHDRIGLLPSKYDPLKVLFFAVKWIGNTGSHSGRIITDDDVLDGYEIMEKILKELFEKDNRTVQNMAKEIHKRKGPRK